MSPIIVPPAAAVGASHWDGTAETDRIVINRSATLTKTFQVNGVATDPTGAPTCTITRISDGTAVTTGPVTDETPAGTWSVTIPASSNDVLDALTVTWTGVVATEPQEYVDYIGVAGETFFTIAEMRALLVTGTYTYTDTDITKIRTTVEQELEQKLAFACVPRYARATLNGPGGPQLMLRPYTSTIRDATIDGSSVTDLTGVSYGTLGTVYNPSRWACGVNNIVVGYEHGLSRPPGGCKRAALILAKTWLVGQRSPIDDRAITFSTAGDMGSYSLAVPGRNGSHFGVPDVDAWIDSTTLAVGIA